MIEFDTCMATAERIKPTILPSHGPPPFYHHHNHHHHSLHHQQMADQSGVPSNPRLNSLLTKTSLELAPQGPMCVPDTPNSVHHTNMNGHSNSHHSAHHNHHHQEQHSSSTTKKLDRSNSCVHPSQAAGKKHSQIVSKLQQSISSRLKHSEVAPSGGPVEHTNSLSRKNSGHRPRTHSLPPQTDMSALLCSHPPPPSAALMPTKSNILKISTSSSHGVKGPHPAPPTVAAVSPSSLEDAKKKKKSHLSRDELSRVCQCGDVTFEAYNGSSYMIAIRSMGDRKSLIGYRCDWNACGYMNARVERMFGHIRSQHPEAPTVKKLVTTTGPTMSTGTITTTTSTCNSLDGTATSTTNSTSTTTTSSSSGGGSGTTSARLSLRSSSSLSTASSTSSSSLSPHQQSSTLLSVLNGDGAPSAPASVKVKRSHNKVSQGSKCSTSITTSSSLDVLENITVNMFSGSVPALSDASPAVNASSSTVQLKHTEETDSVIQDSDEKLMDLLKSSNVDTSVHIKREEKEEMVLIKKEVNDEEIEEDKKQISHSVHENEHKMTSISNGTFSEHHMKVELNSPIDEMIAEANLDGDKLAALDPLELAETTEQIMQELKTISSNCEQQSATESMTSSSAVVENSSTNSSSVEFVSVQVGQHHSPPLNNHSFASPVDRNNNHHLGNGTNVVAVSSVHPSIEPQSLNMCNGNENLLSPITTQQQPVQMLEHVVNKVVDDPLDLFDEDIQQLLNEQAQQHNEEKLQPNYSSVDNFPLDGPKYTTNISDQQVLCGLHSSNVTLQCQGQEQVTVAQHQHIVPSLTPINTTSSGNVLDAGHPTPNEYDEYHNMNEFSFGSINPSDSLIENGHLNEEKMLLPHSQSVRSEVYDAESTECFDMESGMHDDGSNGSGSSAASAKSRTGSNSKKTGSSKNYIGKQNLFQEFQSEDVAKVRDSENQYIIALQKNMKIVGYRCDWPECEFLTCRKYVMVNHINGKHTNQRPYSCPLCNFNFVKRYFLKAHMHKVHKRRISIDGKDDDDDLPVRGEKREHDMMDSFDDNQFEGIPDTPETPNTLPSVVPPVAVQSKKKSQKSAPEPLAYPSSALSNGSNNSSYFPGNNSVPETSIVQYGGPHCPPLIANGSDIPATVQQYANNYNSSSVGYQQQPVDPMISGRGQINGNGCYYGDDSYGSDSISAQGASMAMIANSTAPSVPFKGGQGNKNSSAVQQSAVFMTPSPSSSVASPLSFPSTTGTPTQKCASFSSQTSMYDNSGNAFAESASQMYNTTTTGNSYAQQQQPFMNRSYSQSSQSSSMYGSGNGGLASKSPLSSGMMNTADLLTPPLSSGSTQGGNCCRSGSISGTARMSNTPNNGSNLSSFPSQDSFNAESSSIGQQGNYQNTANGFDDFLSPPSSISSSNSNFSGYMNCGSGAMCVSEQSSNVASMNGSSNQRQASVGGCASLSSTPASASMANASSFYLHTPSPSPSSLSHSPASAPVYGSNSTANSYNSISSQPSSNQYQTNFSNAFPSSDHTPTNNNNSGMVNQSSTQTYPAQSKPFSQKHASFGQHQQQSMRSHHSGPYNNQSQQMQYSNSYDANGYCFEGEPIYPPAHPNSTGPRNSSKSAAGQAPNNSNHFYGNFTPMNPTNGLFDSYADSYSVGSAANGPKQMYTVHPSNHHSVPAAQTQPQTTFLANGGQCWNW